MDEQPSIPPPLPAPPVSKNSGLAIASLIFGILGIGCLVPIVSPILALTFGIIALNQINSSRGALRGHGQAIAGVVFGVVGLAMIPILAGMLLPALATAREKARRVVCMNNERQIFTACMQYSALHNDTWPTKLDDLRALGVPEKVFHCPSAPDPNVRSYFLVPQANNGQTRQADPNDVRLRENPADHHGVGGNVVYDDGHIAWMRARDQQ